MSRQRSLRRKSQGRGGKFACNVSTQYAYRFPSEEYWKLYEQYAEIRQKLADAEDALDTSKRQLDDAKAERTFSLAILEFMKPIETDKPRF